MIQKVENYPNIVQCFSDKIGHYFQCEGLQKIEDIMNYVRHLTHYKQTHHDVNDHVYSPDRSLHVVGSG